MPLTATGYDLPTLEELLTDIEDAQRAALGQEIPQGPTTFLGIINAIYSNALRQILEAQEAVYSSFDEGSAVGAALARLGALTGSFPSLATQSVVLVDVTVQQGFSYLPGDVTLSVQGSPERTFTNSVAFDNLAGPGDQVVAGVTFRSTDTGPIEAPAGTLTVIAISVSGIVSATNPLDADPGLPAEADEDFRVRRRRDLARGGNTTVDAITVNLEDLLRDQGAPGGAVRVFENVTDVTDGDGLPPHSIECLVYDGTPTGTAVTDLIIGQEVWTSKGGGIQAYGTTPVVVVDSQGNNRNVAFSRPTTISIEIEIDVEPGVDYDAAVETKIKQAIADYGEDNLSIGDDVRQTLIACAVIDALDVPREIIDIAEVRISETPNPPVAANFAIATREVADLDTTRIIVTTV